MVERFRATLSGQAVHEHVHEIKSFVPQVIKSGIVPLMIKSCKLPHAGSMQRSRLRSCGVETLKFVRRPQNVLQNPSRWTVRISNCSAEKLDHADGVDSVLEVERGVLNEFQVSGAVGVDALGAVSVDALGDLREHGSSESRLSECSKV